MNVFQDRVDLKEVSERIKELFKDYKYSTLKLDKGYAFYRGTVFKEKPTKISKLSYPPVKESKPGRANFERQQMFYCSSTKHAPCCELELKEGDRIILSKWVLQKPTVLNVIGKLSTDINSFNTNLKKDLIKESITNIFCMPVDKGQEDNYKLTATIAQFLFQNPYNKSKLFDIIAYPATIDDTYDNNFAIQPVFIDNNNLTINEVEYVELIKKEDAEFHLKLLDKTSKFKNETIEWEGPKSDDEYILIGKK